MYQLCFSAKFYKNKFFHGKSPIRKPEWPPSFLRFFQALIATAARMYVEFPFDVQQAFRWLENQKLLNILTPSGILGSPYNISIPNNNIDSSTKEHKRFMKNIHGTVMIDGDTVYYLLSLDNITNEVKNYIEILIKIVRHIPYLGRGKDKVVCNGELITPERANVLSGIRWFPSETGTFLRIPIKGTFDSLVEIYESRNQSDDYFNPSDWLVCSNIGYRKEIDLLPYEKASFSILNEDGLRRSFRVLDSTCVAAMVRHATKLSARNRGWSEDKINSFIEGHGESSKDVKHEPVGLNRFAYFPIPDIYTKDGIKRIGKIRRIMLYSFDKDCKSEIEWARKFLPGQELIEEDSQQLLGYISSTIGKDKIIQYYTQESSSWTTVTPVVISEHDPFYKSLIEGGVEFGEDARLDKQIGKKVQQALKHVGFHFELVKNVIIEWNKEGFLPGIEHADEYFVPKNVIRQGFPRLHIKLQFCDKYGNPIDVHGPICIGGGRFYGLGLFVASII